MEPVIFTVLFVIFIVVIICLVKVVSKNFLKSETIFYKVFSVIPVRGKCEEIEFTVRSVLWSDNWNEFSRDKIILALDNCDDETASICIGLCSQYDAVVMCDINELPDVIKRY